jgi:hypothetical protein
LKTAVLMALLTLFLLTAGCGGGSSTSQKTVSVGAWGRDAPTRVELDVTTTGAALYDLTNTEVGTIPKPITIDGNGHFSAEGSVSDGEGPPPIPNAKPRATGAARFFGTVSGNTITLSYGLANGTKAVGPFTLTYGQTENL